MMFHLKESTDNSKRNTGGLCPINKNKNIAKLIAIMRQVDESLENSMRSVLWF